MSFFSAPKFLAMPAVGFDISADALRFMELEVQSNGQLEVTRYATRNFPLGIISEGHVRDKKKLQGAISNLAREHKLSFANISLPEEQAYLANIRIPRVSTDEVRGVIELHLEEYVPISAPDALFDFVVVGENGGRQLSHINFVRDFKTVMNEKGKVMLNIPAGLTAGECKLISYLQDVQTLKILGAAETTLK